MQQRGITPENIEAAAERIAARGEKPTARAVRAELGGGSMVTIAPALAAWKANRPKIEAASIGVSAEVQRAILVDVERAVATARADLAAELADTQETLAAVSDELRQQTAAGAAAEARATEATAEVERQAGMIATLERSLAEAREQIAREHEVAETARREAAEAAVRLEMVPGLKGELEELRKRYDAEREARLKAEIAAAEMRGPAGGKNG